MTAGASLHQQVALVATGSEAGNINAWDVDTGTLLATYKSNSSPSNAFQRLGRDYLIASQLGRGSLHFWSWHKDHVLQRAFTLESIHAVAASADGCFVAGGGASGTIYIWSTASGQLLRSWPAHYKTVTALVFAQQSSGLLLSGSEDTTVSTWVLMDVLDASLSQQAMQHQPPTSLYSWSEHTLPVTSIHVGLGQANAIAVTSSLDRSCKIWSLAQGTLLRSLAFPASIHTVLTDPADHTLYAGVGDGSIFETSLVGTTSHLQTEAGGSMPAEGGYYTLQAGTAAVTCLALTADAGQMISGSDDGTVTVWDLRTRQPVRTLQKAGKGAVSGVLVMDRPPFLAAGQGGRGDRGGHSGNQSRSNKGPERPQPLAPFSKYQGSAGASKPWEGLPVVIDGGNPYRGVVSLSGFEADAQQSSDSATDVTDGNAQSLSTTQLQMQNEQLQAALREASLARDQWQQLHAELHKACVDKLLPPV